MKLGSNPPNPNPSPNPTVNPARPQGEGGDGLMTVMGHVYRNAPLLMGIAFYLLMCHEILLSGHGILS